MFANKNVTDQPEFSPDPCIISSQASFESGFKAPEALVLSKLHYWSFLFERINYRKKALMVYAGTCALGAGASFLMNSV